MAKNFIIVSCVVLGSVFLAVCAFMINLIKDEQNIKQEVSTKTVQNMNLVNV